MKHVLIALGLLATSTMAHADSVRADPAPEADYIPPDEAKPIKRDPVTQLNRDAVIAFVNGKPQTALRLLLRAKQVKPGYAPTYRLLGRVYVSLGKKSSAKQAYRTYLRLAPHAADASTIKEQLAKL